MADNILRWQKNLHFNCIAYLFGLGKVRFLHNFMRFIMLIIVHIFFLKRALFLRISAWLNLYTQFRAPFNVQNSFWWLQKNVEKMFLKQVVHVGKLKSFWLIRYNTMMTLWSIRIFKKWTVLVLGDGYKYWSLILVCSVH